MNIVVWNVDNAIATANIEITEPCKAISFADNDNMLIAVFEKGEFRMYNIND